MPVINRIKKKKKNIKSIWDSYKENSSKYYNKKSWVNLRNSYVREHPLCQICEEHGYVRPVQEVHHIRPFMQGITEEDRYQLLTDTNNLISVCRACHQELHRVGKRYKLDMINRLNDDQYIESHPEIKY